MAEFTHLQVRLLKLPTRADLVAAHDRSAQTDSGFRMLTVVGVGRDGPDVVDGWGECSALNSPRYTSEWAEGAFDLLSSGRPIGATEAPMAAAAIQMARLDAELRARGRSLGDHLGTAGSSSRAGAVVGLGPVDATVAAAIELADAGYTRLKLKVTPSHLAAPVKAVHRSCPGVELHADANGSLGPGDLATLAGLDELAAVEQPFAGDSPGAEGLAAELIGRRPDLVVLADEAIRSVTDIDRVARAGSATAVAIKAPKLGGLSSAIEAIERATAAGLGIAIGGMLEGGLGRHQLAALAADPRFTITGDLSPARRWLSADPFPDIAMVDGQIRVPDLDGGGISPAPDPDLIAHYTVARHTVDLRTTL